MKLLVKSGAWKDIERIGIAIGKHNPDASERFFLAVREAFDQLTKHPEIGPRRSFSTAEVRSWIIPRFTNFIIFYQRTPTEVVVLAVLHGARDLKSIIPKRLR